MQDELFWCLLVLANFYFPLCQLCEVFYIIMFDKYVLDVWIMVYSTLCLVEEQHINEN